MYAGKKRIILFKYGDIGVILADEIRNDTETYPCKVITELDNPIRGDSYRSRPIQYGYFGKHHTVCRCSITD